MADLPEAFLKTLHGITAKRAKTVIDHILAKGFITTEELKDQYGYAHPPRGARDVREQGIPLETFKVKAADGRSIAAYRFADPSKIEGHKLGGRQVFSKQLIAALYIEQAGRCGVCHQGYEKRYLQVDHRVPYEVAGDQVADEATRAAFMLICATCQRKKSWSCEHCENWIADKIPETCRACYWASPTAYDHIAMQRERRADVVWTGNEVKDFERLQREAKRNQRSVSDEIKAVIKDR